jgi:hypothetical protein
MGLANSKKCKLFSGLLLILFLLSSPIHGYVFENTPRLDLIPDIQFELSDALAARMDALLANSKYSSVVLSGLDTEFSHPPPQVDWPWPERKDPFFAAALSWFIPGLGQVYLGKPLKGGLYWLIDNALFWTAVLNVAHVDFGLERDIGFRFSIRARDNLGSARIWTSVGLGLCYVAFHIFKVLDAAEDASEHNQRLLMQEIRRDGLSLNLTPEISGVNWSGCF